MTGSLGLHGGWWQPTDWYWRCGWQGFRQNRIVGTLEDDLIFGGWRSDKIFAGAGDDVVFGWYGNDRIRGGTGDDLVFGGSGNDLLFGQTGSDILFGNNGRDRIFGGTGDDRLFGGRGNDLLSGGGGSDFIDGGLGRDTARFSGSSNDYAVFADGRGGFDVLHVPTGDLDRLVDVERVRFDDGRLDLDRVQTWQVADGAETFQGRRHGTDSVSLLIDPDLLPSGDLEIVATANGIEIRSGGLVTPLTFIRMEDLHIAFGAGNEGLDLTISGDFDGVLSPNTTYITGTNGDDTINVSQASHQSYVIRGLAGDDTISGGSGNDTIFGGDGDDNLWGGVKLGSETNFLSGGDGNDDLNLLGGKATAFGGAGEDEIRFFADSSGSRAYGGAGNDFFGRQYTGQELGGNALPAPTGITAHGNGGADIFELFLADSGNPGGYRVADFDWNKDALSVISATSVTNGRYSIVLQADNSTLVSYIFDLDGARYNAAITLEGDFSAAIPYIETRSFQGRDLKVTALNRAPVAHDDAGLSTNEDTVLSLPALLLQNDTDPDAQDVGNLEIVGGGDYFSTSKLGALIELRNGVAVYDPSTSVVLNALQFGETVLDSFDYEISDGRGGTAMATAEVLVNGVNDEPVGPAHRSIITEENAAYDLDANKIAQDPDTSDMGKLRFKAIDFTGTKGTLTLNGGNDIATYDPGTAFDYLAVGETGQDSFLVQVMDTRGLYTTQTITVTVEGRNDAATARDDTATIFADQAVGVNVLNNDTDPDTSDVLKVDKVFAASGPSSLVSVAPGGQGVVYDPNGSFDYLGAGQTATDEFIYRVSDGHPGDEASLYARVAVTVKGVNDGPNAVDDRLADSISEHGTLQFDFPGHVLANDTDPDQNQTPDFSWIREIDGVGFNSGLYDVPITLASGAILTVHRNGLATFDANGAFAGLSKGQTGTTSFDYTIGDGVDTDTASVEITVVGENDRPDAVDDRLSLTADSAYLGSVFANNGAGPDVDPDQSDTFSVTAINGGLSPVGSSFTLQSGATIVLGANGTFAYDPTMSAALKALDDTDAPLRDSFTYQITDTNGAMDTALVVIETAGVNDAPVAIDDTGSATSAAVLNVEAANGLLTNDFDPDTADAGRLFISSVEGRGLLAPVGQTPSATLQLLSGAEITVYSDGSYSFDPKRAYWALPAGSSTTEVVNYTLSDGDGSDTAQLRINVSIPPNTPPEFDLNASELNKSLTEDDSVNQDGTLSTSNALYLFDSGGVLVSPLTVGFVGTTHPDGIQLGWATIVGSYEVATNKGTDARYDVSYNVDNSDLQFLGQGETLVETYSYSVKDSYGASDLVQFTYTVNGVNDAPTAADDTGATTSTEVLSTNAANGLLANDTDPDRSDAGSLFITSVEGQGLSAPVGQMPSTTFTLQSGSEVTVYSDGSYSFDPNGAYAALSPGASANEIINYTVSDGVDSDIAQLEINILGKNAPPVIGSVSRSAEGIQGTVTEDTDVQSGKLVPGSQYVEFTDPEYGRYPSGAYSFLGTTHADGLQVGSPLAIFDRSHWDFGNGGKFDIYYSVQNADVQFLGAGETIVERYLFTVTDNYGDSDSTELTYKITGTNDAPVAGADSFKVAQDGTPVFLDLLANDTDVDRNDTLSVTEIAGTAITPGLAQTIAVTGGAIGVSPTGLIAFVPDPGYSGPVAFGYKVSDGIAAGTGQVTGTVAPSTANSAPVATNIAISVFEDGPGGTFAFPASDADPGDSLTFELQATPFGGTTTNNGDGTFTFDPDGDYEDLDMFSFTRDGIGFVARDSAGNISNEGHISVTITGQDETTPGNTAVAQIAGVEAPELFLLPTAADTVEIFNFNPLEDKADASGIGVTDAAAVSSLLATAVDTAFGLELTAMGADPASMSDDVDLVFFDLSVSDLSADWFAV